MFPQIRKICGPKTNTDHNQMCLKDGEEEEHDDCCEGTVCSGRNGDISNFCIAKDPI